mmetsp:Transcript_31947/g.62419  ORF Transcript_31947/g.62419 Transcript_31947/m.62419 type:complete len:108 (-) Transcript_31947:91-414(-)
MGQQVNTSEPMGNFLYSHKVQLTHYLDKMVCITCQRVNLGPLALRNEEDLGALSKRHRKLEILAQKLRIVVEQTTSFLSSTSTVNSTFSSCSSCDSHRISLAASQRA